MPKTIDRFRPSRGQRRLTVPAWAAVSARLFLALIIATSSLLMPLAVLPQAQAQAPAVAAPAARPAGEPDTPLQLFLDVGSCSDPNYGVTATGVGLFQSTTSGVMNLTLPAGSTPDEAYVFWNGAAASNATDGDPIVSWADPGLGTTPQLLATQSYGPALWEQGGGVSPEVHWAWSYRAGVNYSGSGAYTIGHVGITPGGLLDVYNNGAGMMALYRDPSLGPQRVQLAHGLDLMQDTTLPASGPGSEVLAFDFDPEGAARTARMISIVGGITAGQLSQLWYLTGSGAKPSGDLYTAAGAQVINNPFQANNGNRWDTYQTTVTIPANAEWILIQLRSIPTTPTNPQSAPRLEWIAQSLALPLDCPNLGDQTFVDWNNNGVYDPGVDQPFPTNITVDLTSVGGYNASTVAAGGAPNGNYLFADLPADDTFTATVPAQPGYSNSTPLSQTRNLTYPGPDALDVDFGFVPRPGIQVVKTAGNAPDGQPLILGAPGPVVYTYEVTNTGLTYLTNIQVNDNPHGFVCTVPGPLAPGASTTCTKTVNISQNTTNVGTATGTPAQPNGAPIPAGVVPISAPSDTDDAVVEIRAPGLGIDKRLIAPPGGNTTTGNTVTFEVEVTNTGNTVLTTVSLTDTWSDACMALQSVSPNIPPDSAACVGGGACTQTWNNIGPLNPGQSRTFTFTFLARYNPIPGNPPQLPDCSPTTNTATTSGTDANGTPVGPATDNAQVNIYQPSVEVVKTVSLNGQCPGQDPVTVAPGTQVTYCYQVTNTGDTTLAPITVTDDLLGNICTVPSLAPGATQTCTRNAMINQTTTNVATATGTPVGDTGGPIPGVGPVSDDDPATTNVARPSIQVVKTVSLSGVCPGQDPVTVAPGTQVTYCYVVTNTGDTALANIAVSDNLLGAICTIPLLQPGASQTCTQTATINQDTTNVATATGTPSDPQGQPLPGFSPVTDTDDAFVNVEDTGILIEKTVSLDGQCPGQPTVSVLSGTQVTYCFRVTNTGTTYLSNIQVNDNRLGAICTIPLLAPGASQTCTRNALIFIDTANVATASGQPSDPQGQPLPLPPVSDEDDAFVDVVAPAILLEKTVSLDGQCPGQNAVTVAAGTQVTYCYRVTNTGDTPLINVTVTDNVLGPICTIPSLAVGASQTCSQAATVTQDTTNVGVASGQPADPQGQPLPGIPRVQDEDDAFVNTVAPSILIEKTVSRDGQCPGQNTLQVSAGTQVTYCYRVTNTGDTHLANIAVTDDVLGNICTIPLLAPAASQTCTQTATINQDTTNIGTARGTPSDPNGTPIPGGTPVSDDDDAFVDVVRPAINVDKTVSLNGQCPGQNSVVVPAGTTVTYCYRVTNTGDVHLANVTVTDNVLGPICTIQLLAPGATQNCTATATINQDTTNVGTATGTPSTPQGNPIPGVDRPSSSDDATVDTVQPSVVVDKTVSLDGQCPGQNAVTVPPGTSVTYCYRVTNTGDTYLSNVQVTDNVLGNICTISLLAPGASQTCTATATITQSVVNTGTVTGTPSNPQGQPLPNIPPVRDDDDASVSVGGQLGSIGDLVWRDLNVDGYPNVGEPGIPGVLVCLYPDDGDGVLEPPEIAARIGCQTTDANGNYTFVGVPAGTYLVDIDDSNFLPGGPLEDMNLTSRFTLGPDPLPVNLAAGQNLTTADFGYAQAGVDIQKRVGTGCCCAGDLATILPGQTVRYCYTVTNTGDTWLNNVVITDDVLGFICEVPISLAPGQSYTCIKEAVVQADVCNIGTVDANPVDAKGDELTEFPDVSDEDGACVDVVRPAIEVVKTVTTPNGACPGQNSIVVGPGSLVKYCYQVTNTGETYLTDVAVNDDKLGFICFMGGVLAPGASMMCTATTALTQDTTNVATASGDPSNSIGDPYPNMPDVTDTDDALVEICSAGLGDMVWIDFYITDGIQQPQETLGIPGVPIIVVNSNGQQVATAITNDQGKYQVTGLPPGTYTVIVGQAPGYLLTSPGSRTTTLGCGDFDPTMDFGFVDTTAVTLQSLAAQRQGNKTVVTWRTQSEEGNTGFHVWRAQQASGPYVRLTSQPLPSKAPVGGGAAYSYTDASVQSGQAFWYRIETTPDGELFGPVSDLPQTIRRLFLPMLNRTR